MKSTGIVRKIDQLGRIVIPMELRRSYGIKEGDPIEMYTQDDMICLCRHAEAACNFCGNAKNLLSRNNHYICPQCLEDLRQDLIRR